MGDCNNHCQDCNNNTPAQTNTNYLPEPCGDTPLCETTLDTDCIFFNHDDVEDVAEDGDSLTDIITNLGTILQDVQNFSTLMNAVPLVTCFGTIAGLSGDVGIEAMLTELQESICILTSGAAGDVNVKVSSNDTTTGYLISKFVAANSSVTLTIGNPGSAETLRIGAKIPTLVAGANVTITTSTNSFGGIQYNISSTGGGGGTTLVDSDTIDIDSINNQANVVRDPSDINALTITGDGVMVDPMNLLAIIQNDSTILDYFCNMCTPGANTLGCPDVEDLDLIPGVYNPNTNSYPVTINWSTSDNAFNYTVTYTVGANPPVLIGVTSNTTLVANLPVSTNYEIQVVANCYGNFVSDEVVDTITTGASCSTPSGVSASLGSFSGVSGTYEVDINWAANGNNHIVTYNSTDHTVATGNTHTVTPSNVVIPGTTFTGTVKKNCGGGNFSLAIPFSLPIPAAPTCSMPTNVTATVGTYNSGSNTFPVTVTWTAPVGNNNFVAFKNPGSVTTNVTGTTHTFNVAPNTSFSGTVKTDCGNSLYSSTVAFSGATGAIPPPPPAPSNVTITRSNFGTTHWPDIHFDVDPSVTSVVITEGILGSSYTANSGSLTPVSNHIYFASNSLPTGQPATNSQQIKLNIALTNPGGTTNWEYYETTYNNTIAGYMENDWQYMGTSSQPYLTASSITSSSVTINLNLNGLTPNLGVCDYWQLARGQSSSITNIGTMSTNITGLTSGQTYYFYASVSTDGCTTAINHDVKPILVTLP